jgi:hypothetical protein
MSWITTLIKKELESALVCEKIQEFEYEILSKDKKWIAEFKGELKIKRVEK